MRSLTRYPGVQVYESSKRKHRGKPDVCYYIRYRNGIGKLVQEKIGWASEGVTAAYAYQVRQERVRSVRLGDEPIPIQHRKKHNMSFHTYMTDHYLPHAQANKSQSSYKRELQLYNKWIKPVIGEKPLGEISPLDLERVKKCMADAGRAPRTICYTLAVVRQAFNKARAWGLFRGDNPVKQVSFPRTDNRRMRFLSHSEAAALLDACQKRSQQLYEICLLSLHTGMRAGEIFNLRWGDVDVDNGIIYVKDPKNRHNRVAYMTETVKNIFAVKKPGEPDDLVFVARGGGRIRAISDSFDRAIAELGLNDGIQDPRDKVVFHTLRHTFASWLAIQGTPLLTIKELLGHKSISMTERYSHLIPDAKQVAVRRLGNEFEGTRNGSRKMDNGELTTL